MTPRDLRVGPIPLCALYFMNARRGAMGVTLWIAHSAEVLESSRLQLI
jgi:hypothetical protein